MNYIYTAAGACLMAAAITMILEPMELVTGGFSGLAILIKEISGRYIAGQGIWENGIPLWLSTIVLNVPLFFLAYKKQDKAFFFRSLFGNLCLTVFLAILPEVHVMSEDYLLNAILGGMMEGCGLGLVLLGKASTGGVDLLATLLAKRFPNQSISQLVLYLDSVIVLLGILLFGLNRGLYALVAVYCVSKASARVVAGPQKTFVIYIISDEAEQIAAQVMKQLHRGITGIPAVGLYRQKEHTMLLCATGKKQLIEVKEIIAKWDANAFVMVMDARETLGEGFQSLGNYTR